MIDFRIAVNLIIEAATLIGKRLAVVGKSGSGKTNTLQLFAELWMDNGWPLVIIDPMGEFRALKKAFPILVAGMQDDDDLLVTPGNAHQLAEFCFRERLSIVLDVSMHPQGQDIETLLNFLSHFWQLVLTQKRQDAAPWALVVDEAQLYAPQRGETDLSPILIDMGKRGRHKNLTMMVATQRPASIQKDFLTQTNMMLWHRIMLGTDTAILQESLPLPTKEINGMMRKFADGEALTIGDSKLIQGEDYLTVQVFRSRTASNDGETRIADSTSLKPIDEALLQSLRESLDNPTEPEDLSEKYRVLEIRYNNLLLERMPQKIVERVEIEVPVSVLKDEHVDALRRVAEQAIERGQQAIDHGNTLVGMGQQMLLEVAKVAPKTVQVNPIFTSQQIAFNPPLTASAPFPVLANPAVPKPQPDFDAGAKGPMKILNALFKVYPSRVSVSQVATLSDYTASGGAFNSNYGGLKKLGYLAEDGRGLVQLTPSGFVFLGRSVPTAPKTTEEIHQMWRQALPPRAWDVLWEMMRVYPNWLSKEDIAAGSGYTASGGAFNEHLSLLRNNNLIMAEGKQYRASDGLFVGEMVR